MAVSDAGREELDRTRPDGGASLSSSGAAPRPFRIGPFAVLGQIGRGAMGMVYAAYDEKLDRKVALKLLHSLQDTGSLGRSRLLREAQSLARVSHPNVVQVYEVGEHDDEIFIAMEFVRGVTLRAWLAAGSRGWREVLAVYLQAGHGLAAAHAAGVVHRDFKPESECPLQTPPLPPSGRILADGGDLRGAVCRVMPRHAASLATDWQRPARCPNFDQVLGLDEECPEDCPGCHSSQGVALASFECSLPTSPLSSLTPGLMPSDAAVTGS